MAVTTINAGADVRSNRLTTLVNDGESEAIAQKAASAGLSVSAYLRETALGSGTDRVDAAALRQVDLLIDKIERDLDGAIAELAGVMARMAAP